MASSPDEDSTSIPERDHSVTPRSDLDLDVGLAELRSDMSIEQLRASRTRRERRRTELTIAGTLAATAGSMVAVDVLTGGSTPGRLIETGADYCCLEAASGPIWIALDAITAVHTTSDPVSSSGIDPSIDGRLADVIEDLMFSEVDVVITMSNNTSVTGLPISVGETVTLRTSEGFAVIPLGAVVTLSH